MNIASFLFVICFVLILLSFLPFCVFSCIRITGPMLKKDIIPILIASSRKLRVVSYDRVYRKSVDKIRKWISINLLCTSPRWCDAAAISPALCCVAAQMGANNSSVQNEATASGVLPILLFLLMLTMLQGCDISMPRCSNVVM